MAGYLWLPVSEYTRESIVNNGIYLYRYVTNYYNYNEYMTTESSPMKIAFYKQVSGSYFTPVRVVASDIANNRAFGGQEILSGSSTIIYTITASRSYSNIFYGFTGGGQADGYLDLNENIPIYDTLELALAAMNDGNWSGSDGYPITYHYTNSTVSGPSEAAVGDTVTVSAVPDVGYGITDASTQILVINDDVAVPYTWDAVNQRVTFTMPEGAVTVSVTASLIPTYPITYRPTRVALSGPERAAVDSTVNVDCTFPEGYGVKTTDSITVTCNRVPVPFSWDSENQRITFTMPDPTGGGE